MIPLGKGSSVPELPSSIKDSSSINKNHPPMQTQLEVQNKMYSSLTKNLKDAKTKKNKDNVAKGANGPNIFRIPKANSTVTQPNQPINNSPLVQRTSTATSASTTTSQRPVRPKLEIKPHRHQYNPVNRSTAAPVIVLSNPDGIRQAVQALGPVRRHRPKINFHNPALLRAYARKCYICHVRGHLAKDCLVQRKRRSEDEPSSNNGEM